MNKPLRILLIMIILASLAACGRRQAALQSYQATSVAATLRASGQQPPAPASGQQQPAPGQDQPQPQPQPDPASNESTDLTVTRINPSENSPVANQGFEVAVTIQNRGPGAAPSFRWILIPDYREGGPNTPSVDMGGPQLASREKITIRADALYTAPGTYTMRAQVNAGGNPNDPDPGNDYQDIQITVGGGEQGGGATQSPDLAVTNIQLSNPSPAVNERVEVAVTVRNIGAAPSTTFTWALIPDYRPGGPNTISSDMGIPELPPGKEMTIRQDVTYATPGVYTLRATANAGNNPDDTNPANDYRDVLVTVGAVQDLGGSPRLVIAGHSETPATFKAGEEVKFTVTIENKGNGAAQNVTWAIYPAYQEGDAFQVIYSGAIERLEAGASTRVTARHTYNQPGTYTVRFAPDIHDVAGSANQWTSTEFTVQPASGGGGGGALTPPSQCTWQKKTDTSILVSWKWQGDAGSIQGFRIYEVQLGRLKKVDTNIRTALVTNLPSAIPPTADFYVVSFDSNTESAKARCSQQ